MIVLDKYGWTIQIENLKLINYDGSRFVLISIRYNQNTDPKIVFYFQVGTRSELSLNESKIELIQN